MLEILSAMVRETDHTAVDRLRGEYRALARLLDACEKHFINKTPPLDVAKPYDYRP